jgi:hypothetical protein
VPLPPASCSALACVACGASVAANPAASRNGQVAPRSLSAAAATTSSSFSFGQWAGYVWSGRVTSVQASWTVPRILSASPGGVASTWIGTSAPAQSDSPFIQAGSIEERSPSRATANDVYRAFWTDTVHHFLPILLFVVRPGDELSAKLTLAHHWWTVSIMDATSGSRANLSTSDEAQARFDMAGWFQEHPLPSPHDANRPYPYPRLSTVRIRRLAVDSEPPRYADVSSVWMSANGGYIAPSPVTNDSFTLRPETLTPAGRRYLRAAEAEDAGAKSFGAQAYRWTAATSSSLIATESTKLADALRKSITEFESWRWPEALQGRFETLITETSALLTQTQSASDVTSGELTIWRSNLTRDSLAAGKTARAIRRALDLPQITSVGQ